MMGIPYVPSGLGYLGWPSPLTDPGLVVKPPTTDELSEARLTVPIDGVLRVEIGATRRTSPMLTEGLADNQAPGAHLGPEGLTLGSLRPPDPASSVKPPFGQTSDGGWLLSFALNPESRIYGGGESFQGPDLRGRVRRMVNVETHTRSGLDASYLNVPLIYIDAGWGLFFHTSAPVRADLGATHTEVGAVAVEGPLDVFVLTGTPAEILRKYLELTGRPGRFPDWALGVWISRCSFLTAGEIDQVVDELNVADCPVDVVHVDGWMTGNVLEDFACNWEIDRERFPEGWARKLRDRGIRVSLWHNPYVIEGSPIAKELDDAGLLAPGHTGDKEDRRVVDFTNPEAVGWWKERVRSVATTEGIEAFKPDFGEEVPEDAIFADGRTGRQLRNEYALLYQRATHEAMDGRVALFCRSGTAGSQRYPCHWVGDTPSTWTGLVTALRACLSLSLSGFGFVAADVGGFWAPGFDFEGLVQAYERVDPTYFTADVEPELFARWTQWGALSPVMRFHGTGRREPTAYPEPWRSAAIAACRLRRDLRDYLIKTAGQASDEGIPMMRPMAGLQYMLGDDILVAPILQPGGAREFYAPPGEWRPLMGLEPVSGPGSFTVDCDLEQFPAFVRAEAPWPL